MNAPLFSRTLASLLLASLLACAPAQEETPASRPPNVLLIVLDTTRADVLSSYGRAKPTTPFIDRLGFEGARFEEAFTTDFYTLPAHASLLTGRFPSEHGATSETNRLPPTETTLAERLREAGYRTAAFVSNPWLDGDLGFRQGFELYVETWRPDPEDPTRQILDRGGVAWARDWIRERAAEEEPFFAFLNLNRPHLPYYPSADVLNRLSPGPRPLERVLRLRDVAGIWLSVAGRQEFDALDFEILNELYEAEVAMADAHVGELVETLRETGQLDETLVLVTSDHGENIGDHGLIDHMLSMYDSTIRVPLVMRYPPRIEAGTVDTELASLIDVYPTILDAASLLDEATYAGPGSSLLTARQPPPFVIAENERPVNGIELLRGAFPDFDTSHIDHRMRMLRTPRHKLIWREGQPSELYDLEADPGETNDLATAQPALTAEMEGLLEDWMARTGGAGRGAGAQPEGFRSDDAQTVEELRALGYIE